MDWPISCHVNVLEIASSYRQWYEEIAVTSRKNIPRAVFLMKESFFEKGFHWPLLCRLLAINTYWLNGGFAQNKWRLSRFQLIIRQSKTTHWKPWWWQNRSKAWDGNSLQWRHNGRNGVSNHQHRDCLLSRLIRPRSKKTPKLRITGLCAGNSPATGDWVWYSHPISIQCHRPSLAIIS